MADYVIVSDYEKVSPDSFYLTDEWLKTECPCLTAQQIRAMAENGELFEAFIVGASTYCTYQRMDAHKVYIDRDGDVVLHCESAIIENDHLRREKYGM